MKRVFDGCGEVREERLLRRLVLPTAPVLWGVSSLKVLLLSDLHLNGHGKHNNSQKELIREVLHNHPPQDWILYLVGDIFDLWEDSWARICRENDDIIRQIISYNTRGAKGNHDEDLGKHTFLGRSFPMGGTITGTHFHAEHGNRLDPACTGKGAWVGRTVSAVWGGLEYVGLGDRLIRLRRWATRRYETASKIGAGNGTQKDFANGLRKTLVVMGHSHEEELVWLPNKGAFLNLGCGVNKGRLTFGTSESCVVSLWERRVV